MEDSNHRLHSIALSESEENNNMSNDKPMKSNNTKVYKIYDENASLLCKCLDWCSWYSNNVVCFMCCCSITFE